MNTESAGMEAAVSREKLMQDLRLVVSDTEELLRATAGQTGEKISALRERIQDSLVSTKARLAVAQEAAVVRTKQAAKVTDEYVHENPWNAIGIAAGVGLLIGILIGRGR